MKTICGIDYSIGCPALCINSGEEFSLSTCSFYYLTNKHKFERHSGQFQGHIHKVYTTQEERFDQISEYIVRKIPRNSIVYLEGFSYGSRAGLMFDIAAATGILKHKLYKNNIEFITVSPKTIKKFATGSGNSSKLPMYEAFYKETKFNLLEELNIKTAGNSPQSDIVDSFYITKYGFYDQTKNS